MNARNTGGLVGALGSTGFQRGFRIHKATEHAPRPAKAPKSKLQVKDKPHTLGSIIWTTLILLVIAAGVSFGLTFWFYSIEREDLVMPVGISLLIIAVVFGVSIGLFRAGGVVQRNRELEAHAHEHPEDDPSAQLEHITRSPSATAPAH